MLNRNQIGNWITRSHSYSYQITSYGSYIRFAIKYRVDRDQGSSQSSSHPSSSGITYPQLKLADVIISGNGLTLYHVFRTPVQANTETFLDVRFWEGEWHKSEAQFRGDVPMTDLTTREDILLVLSSLEHVHIRATYDHHQLIKESSLLNLEFETGVNSNSSSLEQAVLVEKCTCPAGYRGSSCEVRHVQTFLDSRNFPCFSTSCFQAPNFLDHFKKV